MTILQILTKKEIQSFDSPPKLSRAERKKYFKLTGQVYQELQKMRKPHTQIGFILHLGYFKATGRFYSAQSFNPKDAEYVMYQLGFSPSQTSMQAYDKTIFFGHKSIILELTGILPFSNNRSLFDKQLDMLVSRFLTSRKVFFSLVDWLKKQKTEIPSYNFLAKSITETINKYEKVLEQTLEQHLDDDQKELLDSLLEHTDDIPRVFKLTPLKNVDQSEKPGKIKSSVATFMKVKDKFQSLLPAISSLNLAPDTWRACAKWVMTARSSQVAELVGPYQRYLYLIAFIYHQYCFRQDCFVRILLNATDKVKGEVVNFQKERHYQAREAQQEYVRLSKERKEHYQQKWEYTCTVVNNGLLQDSEKVAQIRNLIKNAKDNRDDSEEIRLEELEGQLFPTEKGEAYRAFIGSRFIFLKNRIGDIMHQLEFDENTSDKELISAIHNYRTLKDAAFCRSMGELFGEELHSKIYNEKGRPLVGLCKALFYLMVADGIKSGRLNIKHSYKYRSVEDYLIPKQRWEREKESLIEKANLSSFKNVKKVLLKLKEELEAQYEKTNSNILSGLNPYATISKKTGKLTLNTPGVDKPDIEPVAELLEKYKFTHIGDILSDVNSACNFMEHLQHRNVKNVKGRPTLEMFLAGIISYGCNIGVYKMGQIAKGINANSLTNTVHWYFSEENIRKANDTIVNITKRLPLHKLFRHHKDIQQTSSDGQKYNTAVESLNASYSFKYLGKGKGVTVYGFVDEAISTFYSTVIMASEREATYVLDGLLHNETYWDEDKEWLHHTDSHGISHVMFAATNLLGISLSPRIKNLKSRHIYAFDSPGVYKNKGYVLTPTQRIDTDVIEENWDDILRLMVTVRLKEVTASSVFSRLSSYAQQNPLYQAMAEMGKIYLSKFVLKYYDELELRQLGEKQLNKVERSHQFAHAVFFDNNGKIRLELKEDQDTAVGCRVLIQNAIILWNCLKLSEQLLQAKEEKEKQLISNIIRGGSASSWQHANMQGVYEFLGDEMSNLQAFEMGKILDMKVA